MNRHSPAPMCHVIDGTYIDLSTAGSPEIAAITRHRIALDAVTPSQPSAEVRDQMRRDPHGSGLIRGVIIGLIVWACILAAVIAGSHIVASATERATHDTAGMICPTPAC